VTERSEGLVVLAIGLAVIVGSQLVAPHRAPPLYDGVVVEEPYRYLSPPPGRPDQPMSFKATLSLDAGQSPKIAAATPESPPQAQLIAAAGAFGLPPGTTSVSVSIEPVAPAIPLLGLTIVGNVYRIAVTNQAGLALKPLTAVRVLLRAPTADPSPALARFTGSMWQEVPSRHDIAGMVDANVGELGEFAAVVRGSGNSLGLDPVVLAAGLFTAAVSVGALVVLGARLRSKARPQPVRARRQGSKRPKPARKRQRR
jgi:hypothetical protein